MTDAVNEDELDTFNEIQAQSDQAEVSSNKHNEYANDRNLVRERHRDLRDNIDRLERLTAKGPNNQEFVEPKVQALWRVAADGNFSNDELASIKMELMHYESRLLKLRHLHAENALNRERYKVGVHANTHDIIICILNIILCAFTGRRSSVEARQVRQHGRTHKETIA